MSRNGSRFVILTFLVACAASGAAAVEASRRLTVEDYFRLREVADPRVSPEGAWVAYTVTTRDLDEDENRTRIWMVPAAGGEAVALTSKATSSSHPRWSPDGKSLAFLSARDEAEKRAQVWTLFRQGGEAVQLTDTPQSVKAFEWAPDGRKMVLVLQDPTALELAAAERRKKGEKAPEDETQPPWVVDRRQFKQDYIGYLDRRRTHLYVLDVDSGELTQITRGDFDDSQPAWSPDGRWIAFVSNRTEEPDANYDTDVWVVAAAGGEPRRVTVNPGTDSAPAWSPDGSRIVHLSTTDTEAILYATVHLAVTPAAGGQPNALTAAIDRWIYGPRFARDGGSVLFLLEDSGELALARIPASGGPVERLVGGPRSVAAFDLGLDGTLAALVSEPHLPHEVFTVQDGTLDRLTRVNDEVLAGIELGEVENVEFDSRDGTRIEGFVVKPPDFEEGRRHPALLRIHGGPMAQYDFAFDFEAQLFAAAGYVVALPNPRGSTGYGQEFTMAIWRQWGGPDYEDVIAAVDDLVARGWADPERLGVGGWSYGGMMTNHVIVKTDRFKAAITGASATLYVVNYGHDQYQRWWEYELGLPWREEDREIWEELSPFNDLEKAVTPTLVVGGEKDWNVPIINSEQLYLALKRQGTPTQLVVYPGEYHGIATPSYRKDLYERYLSWYGRYLKGEEPAEDESAAKE